MADDADAQRSDERRCVIARTRVCTWERQRGAMPTVLCGHLAVAERCCAGAETVIHLTNSDLRYDRWLLSEVLGINAPR